MKQLGGLDELFFALERPNQCMHQAVLGIYDPSTSPGGKVRLRDIMAHIRERLDVAPVLRRRLVRAIDDPTGFGERLVQFWCDHFTVRALGAVDQDQLGLDRFQGLAHLLQLTLAHKGFAVGVW